MATTYTTNFHLGMQTNTADKFDMSVITDNMPIIDTALSKTVPSISVTINNVLLEDVHEGVRAGLIATEITGLSSDTYGVVRAYALADDVYMQIAEYNSDRKTRYKTNETWTAWSGGGE